MSAAIIMIGFIVLFVGTIALIQFPELATEIYTVMSSLIQYMGDAIGIVWFFVPKQLTLTILALVLAIEVIIRGIIIFLWIYNHLKQ